MEMMACSAVTGMTCSVAAMVVMFWEEEMVMCPQRGDGNDILDETGVDTVILSPM